MIKKSIVLFTIAILGISTACLSCSPSEQNKTTENTTKQTMIDFLLSDNLSWSENILRKEKLFIIQSNNELYEVVNGTGTMPSIDFNKYTLLVISSSTKQGVREIKKELLKKEDDTYILDINVYLTLTDDAPTWIVSVLVPKFTNHAKVKEIITIHS